MSEKHDEDGSGTSGINRRSVLRRIGTTAAVGAAGATFSGSALAKGSGPTVNREEQAVAQSTLSDLTDRKVSKIVLDKADSNSFDWGAPTAYRVTAEATNASHEFWEVVAESKSADVQFDYIAKSDNSERTATIKTSEDTIYRATEDEDGISTEHLRLGDRVTKEIVAELGRGDKKDRLMRNGVSVLNTDEASAHRDLQSGTDRLFIGAKMDSGEKALLLIEMAQNGDLNSAKALNMSSGSGMVHAQDAVGCFGTCIAGLTASIGYYCYQIACGSCIAVPNVASCGTCLACAGGTVGVCATGCGASAILS